MAIIEEFKTYIKTELGLSQETLIAYVRDIEEFLSFVGVRELNIKTIDSFINYLYSRNLKSSTIHRKCMSVRCLCRHLISSGRLDPEIIKIISPIRVNRRIPDALDNEAVNRLVAAVEQRRTSHVRRDVAIIVTLYHSGLRVSELCGLNISDINFDRRELRVRGKGCQDRVVPTTKRCLDAINDYLDNKPLSTNAVFVRSDGERLTRRAISDMLVSVSRLVNIPHTTAHMLRRSCATSLMNNGVDIELVQQLLGHKNLSTTQAYLAIDDKQLVDIHKRYHPFGEQYGRERQRSRCIYTNSI